jgi:hypothetical protein
MKSRLVRGLALVGGIAAAGALTAASAFAHPAPFTLSAGSASSGTVVAVTGTSGIITFRDTTTGINLSCTSVVAHGTGTVTSTSSGVAMAQINGSTAVFNGCTGPAGLKFAVTGNGTWDVNITDSTAGVSTGTISNIRAHVVSTAGPTCAFDVGSSTSTGHTPPFTSSGTATVDPGTVAGTYTNSTSVLAVIPPWGTGTPPPPPAAGPLGLWNVHGSGTNTFCVTAAILAQGNSAAFQGNFALSADVAANNPLAIN